MSTPTRPGRRTPAGGTTVITSAYQSREEELDARKRRYVYAMSARVVLFALAVVFLRDHLWALLPAMAVAAILPYVAVVLANGGRKTPEMGQAYVHDPTPLPAIEAGRTIDAD